MSQDEDQPLINLTLEGDTSAFAKIVKKYEHMVFALAMKLMQNKEEAQEVAQDAFLKAYSALGSFKGDSKFSTWLYKITYNKGLDELKKRKRTLEVIKIDNYLELNVPDLNNSWESLEVKERKITITKAIHTLRPEDKVLITLFYFDELSLNEIAVVLGLEISNVKVRLHRVRHKLAKVLRKIMEPETIQGYEKA